ncbi:MAG TPA: 6-carboxytetrahydropterin synthase [Tepidisphaeraceae bacterium]|jgi:6-pyruvoyltetrahydropterin/6-carboxytetrahydropterin synthase
MYRLCREVRFNLPTGGQTAAAGTNGHAGTPAADGPAVHWAVRVTLSGDPDPTSAYLIDIKRIDDAVRREAFGLLAAAATSAGGLPGTVLSTFAVLKSAWPGRRVERVEIVASPYQSSAVDAGEPHVTQLSQHFEFSAAHRLHNPSLGDAENRQLFGKCNNPHGHGHNYEVKVTIAGTPDEGGRIIGVAELERLVEEHAIRKVDHKFLNAEVVEFQTLNPSVENIARVIYGWLKPHLKRQHAALRSVTVWETPKTSCEYSGDEAPRVLSTGTPGEG